MKKHIAEDYRVIVWPETRYSARDDKVIAEDIVNQIKHHVDDFRQVYIECTEKDICSFCESKWEAGEGGRQTCCSKAIEEWEAAQKKERPCNRGGVVTNKIICLCGSTRFTEQMLVKQWELTRQGYVVLSWCALPEDYFSGEDKAHIGDQEGVKEIVDAVHFRKIELANEVFVINIGGYIGESTRNEIEYAKKLGKKINYLEPICEAGAGKEEK